MEDKTCPVTEQDLLIGGVWFWLVSALHGVWSENEKTLCIHSQGDFAGVGCLCESNFLKTSIFFKIKKRVPRYKIQSKIPHCVLHAFVHGAVWERSS